jgi:hypothetical protein
MASPPSIQRFYSDDYKEAPTWFKSTFLNTLNLFVFPVYNAVNKNLTVADNLNQGYETITITGNSTPTNNVASFLNPIQGDPTGVTVVNVQVIDTPTPTFPSAAIQAFFTFDGTSINIGSITGLSNGVNYQITLKVE